MKYFKLLLILGVLSLNISNSYAGSCNGAKSKNVCNKKVYFSTLKKNINGVSLSSVRGTGHWIETFVKLENNNLKVRTNFINDNRGSGYTGCSSVKVMDNTNSILYESLQTRGVKRTLSKGRKTRTATAIIPLTDVVEISHINITQLNCKSGRIKKRLKKYGRQIEKAAVDVVKFPKNILKESLRFSCRTLYGSRGDKSKDKNGDGLNDDYMNCWNEGFSTTVYTEKY